ncbi:hypothetical protein AB0D32_21900 [Micromonospora sp. NPDC048170]|uniref:hypothetical protein n=1 Tax=Micromonospora sp. NPDC048170 TaxID=3154819 RepID=UPI0033FDA37E
MPVVAALVLTLALTAAPTPTASGGPVGDLLGDIGQVVDDLLTGGGKATPGASPTPGVSGSAVPTPTPAGPSAVPAAPVPAASASTTTRDRPAPHPAKREPEGSTPHGRGVASDAPSAVAAPPRDGEGADRWLVPGLLLGALVVPVLFVLHRRRRPAVAAAAPSSPSTRVPDPDEEPAVDNVTRLPTNLNAIYELGRLDERLSQERDRRP